jgi:hypothetical protein
MQHLDHISETTEISAPQTIACLAKPAWIKATYITQHSKISQWLLIMSNFRFAQGDQRQNEGYGRKKADARKAFDVNPILLII